MTYRRLPFLMNAGQAETVARLVAAAERGDGDAACRLGDMYREGSGGLRYSPKQAFRWYAHSAMAGDATGRNNLGACYEHALGCEQSYLRGHGVPADKQEALRLFRLAADQGEPKAAHELERLGEPSGEHKEEGC